MLSRNIFNKWWDNGNKNFCITNYKKAWKKCGNKPRLSYHHNGAIRGKDSCLDINIYIGYININYTDFAYNTRGKRI